MVDYAYERLSAMDSSFLVFEGTNTHMHVGGTVIFETGPLATPEGGVDIDRIRTYIDSRLHLVPRYRQRLAFVPIEDRPVWIDDDHFNLNYHVRHASLPCPGDERQLKRMCGRIMSQQLDRGKPLWEVWIVEGLEGGRFALVYKTHHCMVDGIAGVDLFTALMRTMPDATVEPPPPWIPRPAPTPLQLLLDEGLRRASAPFKLASALKRAARTPERARAELGDDLAAIRQTLGAGLQPPARTPLNRPIGPHRRFDWLTLDLAEIKEVKTHLGGTVNDVVLATVAGAVRRFLRQRGVNTDRMNYRVAIPVNTRSAEELGAMGNRVSAWLTMLPVRERDPRQRYARVHEITASLKQSKQARGVETLITLGEWAGSVALTLGVRFTSWLAPYNLIITNVPGPQQPLYLLGAPLLAGFPLVPLFENQGLAVALVSYAGKLCWGLNADWDLVPDLHLFVEAVAQSFAELRALARRRTIGRQRRTEGTQYKRAAH